MRINELFKGDSDIKIKGKNNDYFFTVDNINYNVSNSEGHITFSSIGNDDRLNFTPINNNKNQFIVLNAVLKCVDMIFQSNNNDVYYFSGDKTTGLAKVYFSMFNKLKNKVSQYNLTPINSDGYFYDNWGNIWLEERDDRFFYFIDESSNKGKRLIEMAKEQDLPFISQLNESRIDELFKGSNIEVSDMNISQHGRSGFDFEVGGEQYRVEDQGGDLVFYNGNDNDPNYEPTKSNKNQFEVLGVVYDCFLKFLSNNKKVYHFSGSNKNGLAKLYSVIFKRLAKDAKNLGYVSVDSGIYNYNEMTGKWWKRPMTNSHYWYFFPIEVFDEAGIRNTCEELKMPIFENRIDELFKGDSDVEIIKTGSGYEFEIGFVLYQVYTRRGEIFFGNMDADDTFQPSKNNKNQFIVLNTVLKCVELILSNKEIYYFSGDIGNGLAKLYSIMFDTLKNKADSMGYVSMKCNDYMFDEDSLFDEEYKPFKKVYGKNYFWFIPKVMMTDYVYNQSKNLDIDITGYNTKINESLYGSKKSSYEKDGQCKLILRHSKTIDEDKRNSRTRNIDKIFLETSEGERIKCPVNNLKGARAWAKYVNKTGIIEDENTDRLFELVEDLKCMKETKKHLYKNRHSLSEDASNDILNLSEGIKSLNKLISRAARTGKIPEIEDIVFTTQISELYSMEDETLIEKAKRAKHRQMSLLAPVIQSEDIEMTETPFTKYAKKWLSDNEQQSDDNTVDMLAKGLKEIVEDEVDYTIDFDPNNTETETVRKFAENLNCPVTSSYVLTIAGKMDDGDELSKVQKQILRHIINGVDSDENLNEFAEPEREELPRKESPEIGDQVSTEYGPGSVVGKEGFTIEVELQNGSVISVNEFNVDVTYRPGEGQIEEMNILESFFKQF